jgi:precorrin-6A/cobalt-precorrin-6A reductase
VAGDEVRVLLLGGTSEASALARSLAARPHVAVTTSFAGRTTAPVAPAGATRVGGFGGSEGLAAYLRAERVDVLVDATHPFAAHMRWHAAAAADDVGIPRLRVERPPWEPVDGDRWTSVADLKAAAAAVRAAGYARVFLSTGRTELAPFAGCDAWFLVRSVEAPDSLPLPRVEVVLARGPFRTDDELALLRAHRIDAVVTKNSGATATAAKLAAARTLGLPVVMVERPPSPPGPQSATVDEAMAWVYGVAPAAGAG